MSRLLAEVVLLTLIFLLALVSLSPGDVFLGVVLGGSLELFLRGRLSEAPTGSDVSVIRRIVAFPGFAVAVVADVALGTWDVALRVLHLRPVDRPGIVLLPIGDRTPQGVAVSALAFTLSPGSLLLDIDWERRVMLVHVIDASDPDRVREQLQRLYDRHQRKVFP